MIIMIDNYDSFTYNLVQYFGELGAEMLVRKNDEVSIEEIVPILGVCLGHQVIVQAFGGTIGRVEQLYHGKSSQMIHDGKGLYNQLPCPLRAGRYHSLIAVNTDVPDVLEVTVRDSAGDVMGVRHKDYAIEGIQFHPESILTEQGKQMLLNFLAYYRVPYKANVS